MNTRPTPISDRIVSQFRKGEATSDGLILTMVELELKIAAICRERDEARETLAAVTAQRDEALSDLEFRRQLYVVLAERCDRHTVELAETRVQRDRLAEALRDIANGTKCQECGGEIQAWFAREALQSLTPNAERTRGANHQ
jgi:predicted  nucleic acid-binding Zn-ribbon protein